MDLLTASIFFHSNHRDRILVEYEGNGPHKAASFTWSSRLVPRSATAINTVLGNRVRYSHPTQHFLISFMFLIAFSSIKVNPQNSFCNHVCGAVSGSLTSDSLDWVQPKLLAMLQQENPDKGLDSSSGWGWGVPKNVLANRQWRQRGTSTKSQVDTVMCKAREIFEDNEALAQANRCKSVFERVIQGTRNSLGKSGGPTSSIFYNSVTSVTVVWKGSWCQTSQTAGEQRIWIPFILFPRIESKAQSHSDTGACGCWGVCADEGKQTEIGVTGTKRSSTRGGKARKCQG